VRKVNLTKTFYTNNRFLIDTTDYLQKPINIILMTQQQAFNIAKSLVPDIELRGMRISDQFSDNKNQPNFRQIAGILAIHRSQYNI